LSERDNTRPLPHIIGVTNSTGSPTLESYLKYISICRHLTDVIVGRNGS